MPLADLDLAKLNSELKTQSPQEIIRWALSLQKQTIMTTSFGFNSAVSLHMLSLIDNTIPVVWIDSGYNMKDAYLVAEKLITNLQLNMQIFNPLISAERRTALMGGIPSFEEEEKFQEFTRQVKLEPFSRALNALQPEVWITGIRQQETEHRRNLDIVTIDARGILKVAPIFYWLDTDVEKYMAENQLPSCKHYYDPTKIGHTECGLHTHSH